MTHNYQQLIIKFTSWGPAPAQCSALSPSALSSQLSTLVFLSQLCRVQRWRLLAPAPALSCIPGIILITSPVNVKLVFRKHVTPTIWSMVTIKTCFVSHETRDYTILSSLTAAATAACWMMIQMSASLFLNGSEICESWDHGNCNKDYLSSSSHWYSFISMEIIPWSGCCSSVSVTSPWLGCDLSVIVPSCAECWLQASLSPPACPSLLPLLNVNGVAICMQSKYQQACVSQFRHGCIGVVVN